MSSESLLEVTDLKVHFPVGKRFFSRTRRFVYAVNGISLTLDKGGNPGHRR
jgi:ABC-type oligopeptide transport system ATPase subunit